MIDTYWSDHCRHTTFGTVLDNVAVEDEAVQAAFEKYLEMRHELGRDEKPVCLMDMGTIGARWLKAKGVLTGLDESEEINACTVKCKVDVDGEEQDWLYLFKNETHNHPTKSSRSAAQPPAWAAPSATPCRAAATSTRPCA